WIFHVRRRNIDDLAWIGRVVQVSSSRDGAQSIKQIVIRDRRASVSSISSDERILSVIRIKRVHRVDDLGEVVFCLRLSGLILDGFESGKEQADQNRNDRDDGEQLDESERGIACCRGAHGANRNRNWKICT